MLHHARSWAPEAAAEIYERGRPDYPWAAGRLLAERLALGPTSRVADVAAGTGKLTRLLVEVSAATIVAVEPMVGMRSQLRARCPTVAVVDATAERLPFADGSLDAVTVAQAFHWFDVPEASADLARVLGRQGRLALVNNRPNHTSACQAELWEALGRYDALAPRPASIRGWRRALDETGQWEAFERFELPHQQRFTTWEAFDARFGSISHVLLLDPTERRRLFDDLRTIVGDRKPIVVDLTTVVEIVAVAR